MLNSYIRFRTTKGLKESYKEAIRPKEMSEDLNEHMKEVITKSLNQPKK